MTTKFAGALAILAALAVTTPAVAVTIAESGDAGDSLATAQVVGAGTTQITGSVDGDVDLFGFGWGGGALTIDTAGSDFDTQLFLFDASGNGVWANDDSSGLGLRSRIVDAALAAGSYFIGISSYNYDPRDAANNLIFPSSPFGNQFAPNAGAGPLASWSGTSFGRGTYSINFSAATTAVSEPGTLALLGLGLLAFGMSRRKATA